MRSSLLALLAGAALGTGLAACGSSDDPADVRADYAPVKAQIVALGSDVGTTVQGAAGVDDATLARQVGTLAERGGSAAQALRGLDVPDAVQDRADTLAAALDKGSADLRRIQQAADGHDATMASRAAQDLLEASARIRDARSALERAIDDER